MNPADQQYYHPQNAMPEVDAMERSETYQLGGMVAPPSAGSVAPPQPEQPPITPPASYKEGGKVKDRGESISDYTSRLNKEALDATKRRFAETGLSKRKKKK